MKCARWGVSNGMSGQLGRLAELLPQLSARLRASPKEASLSADTSALFAQLIALRADIALRLRSASAPSVELLHLDAALGEFEAVLSAAASGKRDDRNDN